MRKLFAVLAISALVAACGDLPIGRGAGDGGRGAELLVVNGGNGAYVWPKARPTVGASSGTRKGR